MWQYIKPITIIIYCSYATFYQIGIPITIIIIIHCKYILKEWDPTNFLVDLSGQYANCKQIGVRGVQRVDKKTPEGYAIIAAVDYTDGSRSDVDAVNEYITKTVDRWISTRQFYTEVRLALFNSMHSCIVSCIICLYYNMSIDSICNYNTSNNNT